MSRNEHVIRKQTLHLQVSRRDNALALQQRFLRLVEDQLLPRLEPVFDRLAGPDEWIELDKLDIDLGRLAPGEPDQVWLDKALRAYTAALEQHLDKPDTRRATSATRNRDLLAFFLTHGALPWWAAGEKLETTIRTQLPTLAGRLPALLAPATARRRWVRQFDDTLQLETFTAAAPGHVIPVSVQQGLDLFPGQSRRELRNRYWESLWEALTQPAGFPGNWLQNLLREVLSKQPAIAAIEQLLEHWLDASHYMSLPATIKDQLVSTLAEELQRRIRALSPAAQKQAGQKNRRWLQQLGRQFPGEKSRLLQALSWQYLALIAVPPPPLVGASHRMTSTDQRQVDRPLESSRPAMDPDGMFVPLAGIVLVHPFLPAFFERLGVLTGEQFSGEIARELAVHLLYHAATGLQHPAEEELPLLKLLCGLDIETPIERELDLTETEQTETLQLLQAVTIQWAAIEGSTPDDLRGSFFVRDGKLRRGDMGWNLTVETKTWDILLTKLPWGLSPVMHTWMKEMLWVDWA